MRYYFLFAFWLSHELLPAQVSHLRMRAWQGDSAAMMELSHDFTFGDGVETNADSAKAYIDKAAAKGHPDAQYLYGSRLLTQVFDAKKYAEGINWLKKAAAQNQEEALVKLSGIYRTKGTGTENDKYFDLAASFQYAETAANIGNVPSMKYVAESYLAGKGVKQNDSLGIAYMKKAAERHKDAVAICRMGDLALDGKLTGTPDPFLALKWYQTAWNLPVLNMDQRNQAEYGMFRVDRFIRQTQNTMLSSGFMVPTGAYQYQIRKE